MMASLSLRLTLAAFIVIVSACNINRPGPTASPAHELETIETATNTAMATRALSPSPTHTASATLEIATEAATEFTPPPSPTAAPTSTSAFIEYVIQPEDTMFYVIQLPQHGYGYEPDIAATVVALNSNISHIDVLPPVGSSILIPRPTPSATAVGARATQAVLATIGVDDSSGAPLVAGSSVGCYKVQSGDSIVAIAEEYRTTLEILSALNREIAWIGCAFTEPGGGPDCRPNIQIDQCVYVPLPTPLPSDTPTPTGDETATPTATHMAPRLLYPSDGAEISAERPRLQWIGLSGLNDADEYLVELLDQTVNKSLPHATIANDYRIPREFVPSGEQGRVILWRVSVARADDNGVYRIVGAEGSWRSFTWSRP